MAPPARKLKLSYAHLASLLFGALLALGFHFFASKNPVSAATNTTPPPVTASVTGAPFPIDARKPWGELASTRIGLERPDELFPAASDPVQLPVWHFAGISRQQLAKLLTDCGIGSDDQAFLLAPVRCLAEAEGLRVLPGFDFVRKLPTGARQTLYGVLARDRANFDQRYPFLYRMGGFEEWFSESGLTPDKIELIENLSYTNANALCFADIELFRSLSSSNENYLLIKALSRVSTELLRVRVDSGNLSGMLDYWGRCGRRDVLKPFLESLARSSDTHIGLGFLLPPFARLRLYTYSDPVRDSAASREDCYWSSMNFFNEEPQSRFFEFTETMRALQTEYRGVQDEPPQFGDIILLRDEKTAPVHMCVYIAEDVVFTKNGAHYFQPWVLMRVAEMMARYPSVDPHQTRIFRKREFH